MRRKRYALDHHALPGEWIPHKRKMQWECCDCGLVHDVTFKVLRNEIWVRMFRNSKETRNARLTKRVS